VYFVGLHYTNFMYICATWHFTVQKSEHPTLKYLKTKCYEH